MEVVPFEGPLNARIYLIGEAPGRDEVKAGRPFVGGAGKILDKFLNGVGIRRGECRIANVMRIRPEKNDFTLFTPEQVREGTAFLLADIAKVKPNVVVPMGNHPLQAIMGHESITKWRGSLLWSRDLDAKVVPTIHPAGVMRNWDWAPLVLCDFRRIAHEAASPIYIPIERDAVIAPNLGLVEFHLNAISKSERVAFDIETTRGDVWMTSIAFADAPHRSICIPFIKGAGEFTVNYWSEEDEAVIMHLIKQLLENPKVGKIAQNAQFDCGVLKWRYGIDVKPLVIDTMCAFHLIYPELPKSLDTLRSIYTNQPHYDHWAHQGDESFWRYNATDAMVTFEVAQAIEEEMRESKVFDFYHTHINPLISTLLEMQLHGVAIDQKVCDTARVEHEQQLAAVLEELKEHIGEEINPFSTKDLKWLLYDQMKLPVQKKKRAVTVDMKALYELNRRYPSPIFDLILMARHIRKMLSTYIDAPQREGRMHTSFNIGGRLKDSRGLTIVSGPESGRLSSSKSIILDSGTNLQNIPQGNYRRMYVPKEGWVWVSIDLSQAENRVVAYLANDQMQMRVLDEGGDIHALTASWLFGCSLSAVDEKMRYFAKRHVHAFNYGETATGFAHLASIPVSEAKVKRDTYFRNALGIVVWQQSIESHLRRNRIMVAPLGNKRRFFGRWGARLLRQAYSWKPQTTVAAVINDALVRLERVIREKEIRANLLLQVHDEGCLECHPDDLDFLLKQLPWVFDLPIRIREKVLVIPFEVKVGKNWEDLMSVEEWRDGES